MGGKVDWGKVWRWAKGAVKSVSNIASKVAPVLAPEFAPQIAMANRLIQGSQASGSALIGGRAPAPQLTRAQLRRMLS